jgi:hypothetical protein
MMNAVALRISSHRIYSRFEPSAFGLVTSSRSPLPNPYPHPSAHTLKVYLSFRYTLILCLCRPFPHLISLSLPLALLLSPYSLLIHVAGECEGRSAPS